MNLFDVKFIAKRVADFSRLVSECTSAQPTASKGDLPVQVTNIEKTLRRTIEKIEPLQMGRTKRVLEDILKEVQTKELLAPALAVHARAAMKAVTEELHARKFLYVAPDVGDLVAQERLFGDPVYRNFPSAREDISEAGNCLAAECSTAAVFHLMRVAEFGLRALAWDRRIVLAKKRPISLATWNEVIRKLEDAEDEISGYPSTLAREAQFEFYHGAMLEFKRFKNIYRNRVSHAREPFDRDQAMSVFRHVKSFMSILAGRISETHRTPLKWKGKKWTTS